jgi:hypothetical protein
VTIARRTSIEIIDDGIGGLTAAALPGLDLTCESPGRRECSVKSFAKMIFSQGATPKPTFDVRLGDSTG